ncbi:hypothetical protein D9M72_555000 [compost metagenome]
MRVERVRADLHGVKVEGDALGVSEFAQHIMGAIDGRLAAELCRQVLLVVDAFRRQVGIELIGTPVDGDEHVRDVGDRLIQSCLAQIAPGADDVRDDIDADGLHGAGAFPCFGMSAR